MPPIDEVMKGVAPSVVALCRGIAQRDHEMIAPQLTPDARWTIVGRTDRYPFGGSWGKEEMLQNLIGSFGTFQTFSFDIIASAQSGDHAFVEALAKGVGPKGATYSNRYLMRFTLADGLVRDVLEHYDPFEALAYVEQFAEPAGA